ncbi:MAG: hypothetical protein KatS3mg057_2651 [Herpetosiphonaceae bacterium]|nr:MAG: hypothetical protein KatS3mg057_2651 [Herpetosiphonaceae bacterium]
MAASKGAPFEIGEFALKGLLLGLELGEQRPRLVQRSRQRGNLRLRHRQVSAQLRVLGDEIGRWCGA